MDLLSCSFRVVESGKIFSTSSAAKIANGLTVILHPYLSQNQQDFQTIVLFTHTNWKKPDEFMRHCSTKWATFLLSLKDWLEREEGRPAPYDAKISVDD